jgi:2-C-methyl-D-erythritol 4-phosphate cytidylyltransferase
MCEAVKFWGIVPAAGVGKRMQADRPKQYLPLAGKTVIEHSLSRLLDTNIFQAIAVAISPEDPYWPELAISHNQQIIKAEGGRERADSVLSGLIFLQEKAADNDWVLVHDAARPCITKNDVIKLQNSIQNDAVGGILALPSHDTLKMVEDGQITATIDRNTIWRALTPQMFRYGALKSALQDAFEKGLAVTDEASALELQGLKPKIIAGRPDNIKITRPEDLQLAEFYMDQQ